MSNPTFGQLVSWLQAELQAERSRGARIADDAMTAMRSEQPPSGLSGLQLTLHEAVQRVRDAIAGRIDAGNHVEADRAEAVSQLDQAVKKLRERAKVNPEQWTRER